MIPEPPSSGAPLLETPALARVQALLERHIEKPAVRARLAAAIRRALAEEIVAAVRGALRGRP